MSYRARRSPALTVVLALALAVALAAGLGCEDEETPPPPPPDDGDPYYAEDFLTTYELALTCRGPSPGHNGLNVSIHVNDVGAAAYEAKQYPLPEGTVIVKVEYFDLSACQNPNRIVVMRKGPAGTAPASGDWEWQDLDGSGRVRDEGQIAACIACHSTPDEGNCGSANDFTCWDGSQTFQSPVD